MRKLAARFATMGASTAALLTPTQKAFVCGVSLNSVGLLVAPNLRILAVAEIALWTGALAEGWAHFVAFERTADDTFQQVTNFRLSHRVQSAPSLALQQPVSSQPAQRILSTIKRAQRTKKNVGRNMRLCFVYCHLVFVGALLGSPLWDANLASSGRRCQVCLV